MIPLLFDKNTIAFTGNGLGPLSEAISCVVTEELNGEFFLRMVYPATGERFRDINLHQIILATPSYGKAPQPFQIVEYTRKMDGTVEIYAPHISHQLNFLLTKPFQVTVSPSTGTILAKSLMTSFQAMSITSADFPLRFYFDADESLTAEKPYILDTPRSIREQLGKGENSALRYFGGELEWDGWWVRLKAARGKELNASIDYGKNLVDVSSALSMEPVTTGAVPYWYKAATDTEPMRYMSLTEGALYSNYATNYPYQKAIPLDLTSAIPEEILSETLLRTMAQNWLRENLHPRIAGTADVHFVPLWQTEEYKNTIPTEAVSLGDTLTVNHLDLGISLKEKVTKTVYNALLDRYDALELGDPAETLTKTIVNKGGLMVDV